jgi:REP element-mobilizing transposase RayT
MPDHFHWLVELHNGDLPKLMQTTKSRSARAINQARGVLLLYGKKATSIGRSAARKI